jgi:hypothetical protein
MKPSRRILASGIEATGDEHHVMERYRLLAMSPPSLGGKRRQTGPSLKTPTVSDVGRGAADTTETRTKTKAKEGATVLNNMLWESVLRSEEKRRGIGGVVAVKLAVENVS